MRLLIQLPVDVFRLVVLEFLEAGDLVRFCIAGRTISSLIEGHVLKDYSQTLSNEFLKWLTTKNVSANSLVLAKPLDESLLVNATCFSAVQSMQIQNHFTTTELGLQSIFTRCINLRNLHLSNPENCVNDEMVRYVGMHCGKISELTLWCVPAVSTDGLRFLAQRLPLLRKLSLGSYNGTANESAVLIFCEYCATLEIFSLSCCGCLTDVALDAISHSFPHLKELRLGGNNSIFSTTAMCQMFQGLPQLTTFNFPFCTSSILEPVCVVHLSQCCPHVLCVETGSIDVDDEAICALARNCPHLKDLSVLSGASLTDASVSVLANLCPNISKLSFSGCASLTNVSLFAIAKCCPHLTSLRTNNCTGLTDAGYIAIAQHCPHLLSIALSCGATDATIMQLALCCSSLICVWCHSSSCFSDAALIALVKGCKELALVDMKDCRGLTTEGVAKAQSFNAEIRICN